MSCFGDNWGLEFTQEEIERARSENRLLSMELELSRLCNLRCIYCYAASGLALENELSFDEITNAIDQGIELGARNIIILGGGEPLLYPDLFKVIDYILSKGVRADLFTNATLITPEIAEQLYEKKVSVVMKQNSHTKEIQDTLAGHAGAFDAIRKGLTALLDAGYPDETHTLGIETIICKQNIKELPALWRWAKTKGIIPYFETMTWQGRAKEHPELEVSIDDVRQLFETLAKIDREEFGNEWTPHPPLVSSHCARHEYSCTVTADGDIHPCPGVSIPVGNIREKSLADILNKSPVVRDLRNIRQTVKGQCKECDLGSFCYGCRGHAYQVSGDYLAEDPVCWLHS
ncbi:MAG: radical SAM protein [Desulfobulbaceae bacterium]|nr:radical SAM protein [Desulfobulbaceae bacterium]